MRNLLITALALFLVAGPALAESRMPDSVLDDSGHMELEMHDGVRAEMHNRSRGKMENRMGSSTASTTDMHGRGLKEGEVKLVKDLKMRGVPGIVSSVSTNSFMMTLPWGKDHATTTVTVNVSSSTKFFHASSTAALSNLAAGTRVVVLGKVSTSTKTIAAERVMIAGDMKAEMEKGKEMRKNIIDRIRDFFKKKSADAEGSAQVQSDSAAAVQGGGFVQVLLNTLFGWL